MKYEGEWLDNQKHGRGTQWVRRDGKLRKQYTGDWVHGTKQVVGCVPFCEFLCCVCAPYRCCR